MTHQLQCLITGFGTKRIINPGQVMQLQLCQIKTGLLLVMPLHHILQTPDKGSAVTDPGQGINKRGPLQLTFGNLQLTEHAGEMVMQLIHFILGRHRIDLADFMRCHLFHQIPQIADRIQDQTLQHNMQ